MPSIGPQGTPAACTRETRSAVASAAVCARVAGVPGQPNADASAALKVLLGRITAPTLSMSGR